MAIDLATTGKRLPVPARPAGWLGPDSGCGFARSCDPETGHPGVTGRHRPGGSGARLLNEGGDALAALLESYPWGAPLRWAGFFLPRRYGDGMWRVPVKVRHTSSRMADLFLAVQRDLLGRYSWESTLLARPEDLPDRVDDPRLRELGHARALDLAIQDFAPRRPVPSSHTTDRTVESTLHTTLGDIRLRLWPQDAPYTVDNIVGLATVLSTPGEADAGRTGRRAGGS